MHFPYHAAAMKQRTTYRISCTLQQLDNAWHAGIFLNAGSNGAVLVEAGDSIAPPAMCLWSEVSKTSQKHSHPSNCNEQYFGNEANFITQRKAHQMCLLQARPGSIFQSLTTLPALLASPLFHRTPALLPSLPLQPGCPVLCDVSLAASPIINVRRVHTVCGRPLTRASMGLADLFGDPADSGAMLSKRGTP